MKSYLIVLGALVVSVSLIGGAIFLSGNYDQYQRRLQAMNAPAGSPLTVVDEAKWQFAKIVGTGGLVGGIVLGSILMGIGWMGKTLEEIRDAMLIEPSEPAKS